MIQFELLKSNARLVRRVKPYPQVPQSFYNYIKKPSQIDFDAREVAEMIIILVVMAFVFGFVYGLVMQ